MWVRRYNSATAGQLGASPEDAFLAGSCANADPLMGRCTARALPTCRTAIQCSRGPTGSASQCRARGFPPAARRPRTRGISRARGCAACLGRWRRVFRPLIEDLLGMGLGEIAWANLAKCRVSIDRGDGQRAAEARVTRLCQSEFVPMRELVEAIRPAAVVCSVLAAGEGGTIVSSWSGPTWRPLVFTFHGLTGHDRSNRDPARRASSEWAPEAAQAIKRAQLAPRAGRWSPNVKGFSRQEPRNDSRPSVLGGRRASGLRAQADPSTWALHSQLAFMLGAAEDAAASRRSPPGSVLERP
ncbi:MAG: hypothetical protein JWO74_1575 [Solirubrobacterales bacterium]|nr:hypothetical protein [Solirubrobacterales bacterium]